MERLQKNKIARDLEKKIVLLTGPRQVGKTWLAKDIGKKYSRSVYLNYDRYEDREIIDKEEWLDNTELLILDELHKKKDWNNYLKGVYDTKPAHLKILVTGSARLDLFFMQGDSLAGRFFKHRLMPLSVKENDYAGTNYKIDRLIERGGFPEPFLAEDSRDANRWRLQYADGLLRTDILDFQKYFDLKSLRLVFEILQRRVGAPVSYNSIARDVSVSPNTVKKYISIFENLYVIFRIYPFSKNIARSLTKEPKVYFFDNGMVKGDSGAKFENFMAVSFLKHIFYERDAKGLEKELCYIRTKEKEEIDFCIVEDDNPVELIETKVKGPNPGKTIFKFHKRYSIPATALFLHLKKERKEKSVDLRRAEGYCREMGI